MAPLAHCFPSFPFRRRDKHISTPTQPTDDNDNDDNGDGKAMAGTGSIPSMEASHAELKDDTIIIGAYALRALSYLL